MGAPEVIRDAPERNLPRAILNGLRWRCPRCGQGHLYRAFLKVTARCSHCGLDLTRHRSDDLPPYIVITIVGHILVVGLLHHQMSGASLAPWVYLAWMVPAAIVLPIAMLPSVKGAVVGFQWAKGMHGLGSP